MYAINIKNKPCILVPHDMLVVSAIFHVGEDLRSKPVLWNQTFVQNIDDE